MDDRVFFIDSKFSKHIIAGKMVKQFTSETIDEEMLKVSLPNHNLFIRDDFLGIDNKIIKIFAQKQEKSKVSIGLVNFEPCMALISHELLCDIYFDIDLVFKAKKNPEWLYSSLDLHPIRGLNTNNKVIAFAKEIQDKLKKEAIENGVYLQDPDTTYLSHDTKFIGEGIIVEPNVYFGPKVRITNNVHIKSFSHLEEATIERGAIIGPFARIRGNSTIYSKTEIGNFVEVKNTVIGPYTKIKHLSYIGDATIGRNANIGAGVVICNYDGLKKYKATIENNCFIGSNSTLISPIKIGQEAFIGAGSFINKNVPEDSFAIGRSKQIIKPNKRR